MYIGLLSLLLYAFAYVYAYLVIIPGVFLQANAFRALRFLFSVERNRRLFKRLFPPDLFEMFIDIGHYVRIIKSYRPLVAKLNSVDVSIFECTYRY